jgi:hypothetical protein
VLVTFLAKTSNFDGSDAGWASGLAHITQFGSPTGLKNSLEETDKTKFNPLRWDEVRLNLPGDPAFDPTLPRVMKWDLLINNIAGDVKAFVDNLRASGIDEETAWRIARQVASRLQYLGIQDAPQKRRPPTRKTGAWAGAIFSTKDNKITQTVSQEKWDEGRAQVEELSNQLSRSPDSKFSYKRLEQIRGVLCHLRMTFEVITPFLKGFHLMLCSHLSSRDDDGWKLPDCAFLAYIFTKNGTLDRSRKKRLGNR